MATKSVCIISLGALLLAANCPADVLAETQPAGITSAPLATEARRETLVPAAAHTTNATSTNLFTRYFKLDTNSLVKKLGQIPSDSMTAVNIWVRK